ncbi:tRNA-splicing endonuclease subunit [Ascosphaera pollenicola]|nr:tRNA-splicing endonuclease subunit [Ascosphaera pollenicola]
MASAGYPFPEAEWIAPTASKEDAQQFVQNYLSWTLQRSFNDPKVEEFAKRFNHSASFLYDASEKQFREMFGEELGSKFHYHMNFRSPYGHSAKSSRQPMPGKRGSTSSASSVKSADGIEMEFPAMPSAPERVYQRGKTSRQTPDYVLNRLDSI